MKRIPWFLALAVLLAPATHAWAQDRSPALRVSPAPFDRDPVARGFVGGALLYGRPTGHFGTLVPDGFGVAGHGIYRIGDEGWLGLRADIGFLQYGNESRDVCFSSTVGCRVGLELTTTNTIATFGIGPQIGLPVGRFQPYLTGSIGFTYFSTQSSLRGDDSRKFASDTNFDDLTFAWTGGGGLYIPLRSGPQPISIDLSVRYHGNGEAEYLREGDILDLPDGTIVIVPNRSEANLWTFQLGVSVGTGAGRGKR